MGSIRKALFEEKDYKVSYVDVVNKSNKKSNGKIDSDQAMHMKQPTIIQARKPIPSTNKTNLQESISNEKHEP